jgi:hypothetical protein
MVVSPDSQHAYYRRRQRSAALAARTKPHTSTVNQFPESFKPLDEIAGELITSLAAVKKRARILSRVVGILRMHGFQKPVGGNFAPCSPALCFSVYGCTDCGELKANA